MSRSAESGTPAVPLTAVTTAVTRAETFAAELERRIGASSALPGDRLGSLQQLRAESGLARATVSEAVRLLRDRGLLRIVPGRGGGLFVSEPNPIVRLRHTLLTVRDSPTTVLDAIAVREALELLVDVDAALHRTKEQAGQLRAGMRALTAAAADGDYARFMRANWALHRSIASMTPNALAAAVYLGALGRLDSSRPELDDPASVEAQLEERHAVHRALVDAIIAGDLPAVRAAVARHHRT